MSERRETPDYHCPNCGELAGLLIGPEQAMCGNEKCEAIFFSPNERYTPDDLAAAQDRKSVV